MSSEDKMVLLKKLNSAYLFVKKEKKENEKEKMGGKKRTEPNYL